MRRPLPRNSFAARLMFQRIDQAAGRMMPYLVVLAIGLVMLNLIFLVRLAPHLPITRGPADNLGAMRAGCAVTPADAALRAGS